MPKVTVLAYVRRGSVKAKKKTLLISIIINHRFPLLEVCKMLFDLMIRLCSKQRLYSFKWQRHGPEEGLAERGRDKGQEREQLFYFVVQTLCGLDVELACTGMTDLCSKLCSMSLVHWKTFVWPISSVTWKRKEVSINCLISATTCKGSSLTFPSGWKVDQLRRNTDDPCSLWNLYIHTTPSLSSSFGLTLERARIFLHPTKFSSHFWFD